MADRILPDWIDSFLQYTDQSESSKNYREWVAISVVAACLKRKTVLHWEKDIYPNMYVILVGPPSARKNTAMDPGEEFIRELGIPIAANATTRESLIKELKQSGDPTFSGAELNKMRMDAALTVFSQEFTVFLGIKNTQLIADLCDWFDCQKKWVYKTKHQGTDDINNVFMNIIGGTTPSALMESLPRESVGMGLTGRIVFVFEENKEKVVIFSPAVDVYKDGKVIKLNQESFAEVEALKEKLIHDLKEISIMDGVFVPTLDYHRVYEEWREKHENSEPFKGTMLEHYANRKPIHLRKLSMIYCAARSVKMILEEEDIVRALKALERVEIKMPMVFAGVGKSEQADITHRVMQFIGMRKKVTLEELQKNFWNDADKNKLEVILQTLETMGFCKYLNQGDKVYLVYIEETNHA